MFSNVSQGSTPSSFCFFTPLSYWLRCEGSSKRLSHPFLSRNPVPVEPRTSFLVERFTLSSLFPSRLTSRLNRRRCCPHPVIHGLDPFSVRDRRWSLFPPFLVRAVVFSPCSCFSRRFSPFPFMRRKVLFLRVDAWCLTEDSSSSLYSLGLT